MTKTTLQDSRQFVGIILQSTVPLVAIEALDTSQACQQCSLHRLLNRQQSLSDKHKQPQHFISALSYTQYNTKLEAFINCKPRPRQLIYPAVKIPLKVPGSGYGLAPKSNQLMLVQHPTRPRKFH